MVSFYRVGSIFRSSFACLSLHVVENNKYVCFGNRRTVSHSKLMHKQEGLPDWGRMSCCGLSRVRATSCTGVNCRNILAASSTSFLQRQQVIQTTTFFTCNCHYTCIPEHFCNVYPPSLNFKIQVLLLLDHSPTTQMSCDKSPSDQHRLLAEDKVPKFDVETIFGDTVLTKNGSGTELRSPTTLKGKYVGIYFSGHW